MFTIEMFLIGGLAVGAAILALVGGRGRDDGPDPAAETANWRRVDAEVLSTLRAGDSTFLLVRFPVGSSMIRNDVRYPLPGAVPHAGQRVPITYDPAAPRRMMFDLQAAAADPARRPDRLAGR